MPFTNPTVADFKSRFDRDFLYSIDQTDVKGVRDKDINLAYTQTGLNFNPGLFAAQDGFQEAFLLLSAHFLCTNLLNSSQGLGGQGEWLINQKAVGNVSASFTIPDRIAKSPFLSAIAKTSYGMTYLNIISPLLVGNMMGLCGRTSGT